MVAGGPILLAGGRVGKEGAAPLQFLRWRGWQCWRGHPSDQERSTQLRTARASFRAFGNWMDADIGFINKVLSAKRVVATKAEKEDMLEAFVLRVASSWEVFVQNLLTDCLHRDTSAYAKHMGMTVRRRLSWGVCEAMITGLDYFDYKSVAQVRGIGRKILVPPCNPFDAIPKAAARRIDEFFTIRNYLSHYSDRARRALMASYRRNHGLVRFREPGSFLYADNRITRQIRLNDYIGAFRDAAIAMADKLGVPLT